jgi:hypothetical protein
MPSHAGSLCRNSYGNSSSVTGAPVMLWTWMDKPQARTVFGRAEAQPPGLWGPQVLVDTAAHQTPTNSSSETKNKGTFLGV